MGLVPVPKIGTLQKTILKTIYKITPLYPPKGNRLRLQMGKSTQRIFLCRIMSIVRHGSLIAECVKPSGRKLKLIANTYTGLFALKSLPNRTVNSSASNDPFADNGTWGVGRKLNVDLSLDTIKQVAQTIISQMLAWYCKKTNNPIRNGRVFYWGK